MSVVKDRLSSVRDFATYTLLQTVNPIMELPSQDCECDFAYCDGKSLTLQSTLLVFLGESMLGKKIVSVLLLLVSAAIADTIPSGAKLTVRLDSAINSRTAKTGQTFHGTLARSLVVNGKNIANAGTPVKGKVTHAKSSGRLHDPGELTLRLTSVEINDKPVTISTTAYRAKGKSHTKGNVEKIGGGAAAGAVIGGLAGGGKGALIGTAAGAGAGTAVAAATGKEEASVPAEAALTFTTTAAANLK
jgi:uncharacterized membrane protein